MTAALAGCAHAGATPGAGGATPPTPAGRWQGIARLPGSEPIRVAVALDSAAAGWQGSVSAEPLGPDPVAFASVRRQRDSVEMHLPAAGEYATLRGRLSADGRWLEGTVEVHDQSGTFRLARAGTADAASLAGDGGRPRP